MVDAKGNSVLPLGRSLFWLSLFFNLPLELIVALDPIAISAKYFVLFVLANLSTDVLIIVNVATGLLSTILIFNESTG